MNVNVDNPSPSKKRSLDFDVSSNTEQKNITKKNCSSYVLDSQIKKLQNILNSYDSSGT